MGTSTSAFVPTKTGLGNRMLWRWRVVDIVVATVIAVAAALIFAAWSLGSVGPSTLLQPLLPGLQGLVNGPWLFAGVLGGLIIRKVGAALYVELLAAVVSALIGNQWGGFLTIEAGLVQGIGAELIFLLFVYKRWSLPVAALAGVGAALAGGINDLLLWYVGSNPTFTATYLISSMISGAVIAGVLSWFLARGIAATGALDRFGSGRGARVRV